MWGTGQILFLILILLNFCGCRKVELTNGESDFEIAKLIKKFDFRGARAKELAYSINSLTEDRSKLLNYSRYQTRLTDISRVYGGTLVTTLDPISQYVVRLEIEINNKNHYCTGVITSSKMIITAAHCLYLLQSKYSLKIQFIMESGIITTYQSEDIDEFRIHPYYEPHIVKFKSSKAIVLFDLAYIKLNTEIPSSFKSIAIETKMLSLRTSDRLVVAAYGKSDISSTVYFSNQLRKTNIHFSKYIFYKHHQPENNYTQTSWLAIIQSQEFISGSCIGDSGGPLFLNDETNGSYKLVGLVSAGEGRCQGESNYSSIPEFIGKWFLQTEI
jgi:secreted trypsin-like serine protease